MKSKLAEFVEWLKDNKWTAITTLEILDKTRQLLSEEQAQKPTADKGLVEELADLEHKRWSGWQTWCHKILRENCPSSALEKVLDRWDKQIATDYKDLSEREKDMDRKEAMKSLEIISRYQPVEPLAVESLAELAERKGIRSVQSWPMIGVWEIDLIKRGTDRKIPFVGKTYAEAEAKAIAYLTALPDVEGGKGRTK